jgi:cation:H+ antiporter
VLIPILLFILGLVVLSVGAEFLVRGAAGLARSLGVSTFVIGATIIAYGTSAPEFIVSAVASFKGASPIALGNVVGSNLLNTGLILGIVALIAPVVVDRKLVRLEMPLNFALTFLVGAISLGMMIFRWQGGVLLLVFAGYIFVTIRGELAGREKRAANGESSAEGASTADYAKMSLAVVAGIAGLFGGAKVMVDAAVEIATIMGISERVIGLTIVAAGTSLPELAAGVAAAIKGESEMIVGNLIGSNIFNLGLILGSAALIRPITIDQSGGMFDFGFLLLNAVMIMAMIMIRGRVGRVSGTLLCLLYVAFAVALAVL